MGVLMAERQVSHGGDSCWCLENDGEEGGAARSVPNTLLLAMFSLKPQPLPNDENASVSVQRYRCDSEDACSRFPWAVQSSKQRRIIQDCSSRQAGDVPNTEHRMLGKVPVGHDAI